MQLKENIRKFAEDNREISAQLIKSWLREARTMAEGKRALSPEQKAAAVVVSLGVDKASQIYKHLNEEDLEKLTVEVAKLQHLTPEETEEVLTSFYKMCLTQKVVTDGGLE